jgi:hypothetical protein
VQNSPTYLESIIVGNGENQVGFDRLGIECGGLHPPSTGREKSENGLHLMGQVVEAQQHQRRRQASVGAKYLSQHKIACC